MPYTAKQCRHFAANPDDAPADWKKHCKKKKKAKKKGRKK